MGLLFLLAKAHVSTENRELLKLFFNVSCRSSLLRLCLVTAAAPDARERTLVAVKPDGVQRRLVGQIIQRFEQRGFKLIGLKMLQVRV